MPVVVIALATSAVATGGVPVVAAFGGAQGGVITNPFLAADQGIAAAEALFVDIVGPPGTTETVTTVEVLPGYTFTIPPGITTDVRVNAATSGHRFSGYVVQPAPPYPPTPVPGPFPPPGPVTVQGTIPSFLYEQYDDDDDLQAFVRSYNELTQAYLDWFNRTPLAIYTAPTISGALLDWVAQGLYGMERPALSSGRNRDIGPLNTWVPNSIPLNERVVVGPSNVVATSDDVFKRIITWNFYKGDGYVFDIRWLKRRVMRFLIGDSGTAPNVDQTYQVSVTFGVGNQVNITLLGSDRHVPRGGAVPNMFALNTTMPGELRSTVESFDPLPNAAVFKEAAESGALQFPFQFSDVIVTI